MHKIVNCRPLARFIIFKSIVLRPKILPITFQGRSGSVLFFERKSEGEYLHNFFIC